MSDRMTRDEYNDARRKIGLSDAQFAAELNANEKLVRAWGDGSVAIPKRDAQWIRWHAALAERETALREAGIAECEWVKARDAEPLPGGDDIERYVQRMEAHIEQCPRCQERNRFIKERFPELPEPPSSWIVSAFAAWQGFLKRFPEWMHPVFTGAVIVTALVTVRILFALPRGASWQLLAGLPLAAALGAVGGLAYSALRPYIAAGGSRKIGAYVLVVLTYLTLGFALLDFGERWESGAAMSGSVGLWSFFAVVAVVVFLWRLGLKRNS